MPASTQASGRARTPDILKGDHVFANHPQRGAIAMRVTAVGKDGFRGVCDQGAKHGVPWADYLGHKARVGGHMDVVDQGADGAVVRDADGKSRFLAGPLPVPPGGAGKPGGKPPAKPRRDDPLLDGLDQLTKAFEAPLTPIPEGYRLILKAGAPIANRPGLALKEVTDKAGHQTHRWQSTAQPESGGDAAAPAMKHGDVVGFKHGQVEGQGKIIGSGQDGVTLQGEDGREHKVRHEHLTGAPGADGAGNGGKPPGSEGDAASGGDGGDDVPVSPDKFSAADFYAKHNDAEATPEKIMAQFPPEVAEKVKAVEADIAKVGQTIDQHKKDGKWTPERAALHRKIIDQILTPETIAAAAPAPGQKPTFTILGGRGGSGKSWFEGKVFHKQNAIVLDADEIKQKLPEYKGWNAAEVHEESGEIFDEITKMAFNHGLNIVHDATMKSGEKAKALIDKFKSKGYRVEAHYMHLPRQEAAKRAVGRFLGASKRYVPAGVVLSNTQNEANFDSIKPHVDAWSFRDNNVAKGQEPRLISEKSDGEGSGGSLRDGQPAGLRPAGAAGRPGVSGGDGRANSGSEGPRGGGFPPGYPGHYGPARDLEKAEGPRTGRIAADTRLVLPVGPATPQPGAVGIQDRPIEPPADWQKGMGCTIVGVEGGYQVIGQDGTGAVEVRKVAGQEPVNFDDPVIDTVDSEWLRHAPEFDAPAPDGATDDAGEPERPTVPEKRGLMKAIWAIIIGRPRA